MAYDPACLRTNQEERDGLVMLSIAAALWTVAILLLQLPEGGRTLESLRPKATSSAQHALESKTHQRRRDDLGHEQAQHELTRRRALHL